MNVIRCLEILPVIQTNLHVGTPTFWRYVYREVTYRCDNAADVGTIFTQIVTSNGGEWQCSLQCELANASQAVSHSSACYFSTLGSTRLSAQTNRRSQLTVELND